MHFDEHGRPDMFVLPTGRDENGEMLFDVPHVCWANVDGGNKPSAE